MKTFLEKYRSTLGNNVEQHIDTELMNKEKLLPNDNLVDNFSLFEQYNTERDNCNNYRLIFNVNPVCTNVLFNLKTEIVVDEGTNRCECLNFSNNGWQKQTHAANAINSTSPIKLKDAIRNTEYSNKENGKFVYHCGIDMFNNHMLRKKVFVHINKVNYDDSKLKVYNTLADYLRDANGNIIKENIKINYQLSGETERHIYNTDSLDTLNSAYYNKCHEQDGWWGFTNPCMINIETSDSKTVNINNMLSNNKPCEFIDFYPDRSLFSFTPKFNKNRKRIEKNWDYCITYPFEKDYDFLNEICGSENGSIKVRTKVVTNASGVRLLQCTSFFNHNLIKGGKIVLYYYMLIGGGKPTTVDDSNIIVPLATSSAIYTQEDEEEQSKGGVINEDEEEIEYEKKFVRYNEEIDVYSVGDLNGDNKERIFSIKYSSIKEIYENIAAFGLFYKKTSNGCECNYYVRKFKKLERRGGGELRSELNKIGFGTNIYGDEVSQIIFTDDIDLYGLKDENGRDVSEVFLTVIKTNKGHEKWYKNNITNSEDIEYSHCFGKITTGVDFGGVDPNEEPFDYNIRYLHNLDKEKCFTEGTLVDSEMANTFSAWGDTVLRGMPKTLEENVSIENEEFYGDVVEFDNYLFQTTTIGNICHRFNTAQRELFDVKYRDLYCDVITKDDYDSSNSVNGGGEFTVKTFYLNDLYSSMRETDKTYDENTLMYSNIAPEGYYYNPHNKIRVKQEGETQHSSAIYLNYSKYSIKGRRVIYIYKHTSQGDVIIGKKYLDDDYDEGGTFYSGSGIQIETHTSSESEAPVVNDRAIGPGPEDYSSVYQVETTEGFIVKITVPTDYGFIKGDYVCFYDKETKETYWGCITLFKDMELTLTFGGNSFGGNSVLSHKSYFNPYGIDRRYFAFWTENNVPTFAKLCLEANEFSWRNLLKQSELTINDELYDTPFSNGRLYLEKNINFFLKRQDPRGDYGLSVPVFNRYKKTVPNPMLKFLINGTDLIDLTKYRSVIDNLSNTCY